MPKTIHFQDRDYDFLMELGLLGLLSTQMIFRRHYYPKLTGDPAKDKKVLDNALKYCEERIRDFRREQLLDTTKLSVDTPAGPRRVPSAHRLLPKGAEILMSDLRLDEPPPRVARCDPPAPRTLLHRLAVVKAVLAIRDACLHVGLPAADFLLEQDRYPDAKMTDPAHKQFILRELFEVQGQRITCRPDGLVLICTPSHRIAGYLENDNATEGKGQIQRTKAPGYALLLDSSTHLYRKHWPASPPDFARVFFIVPTAKRRQTVSAWIAAHPSWDNFRFALEDDLTPERVLTAPGIWHDAKGNPKGPIVPTA